MNDKDRDRCGDEAGPVAHQEKNIDNSSLRGILLAAILSVLLAVAPRAGAQTGGVLRGLSLTVDLGVLFASNAQANFYNGAPQNVNTLGRILNSETYGNQIWNNLTNQDLIGSAVANYNQITVAEYGDMYYKPAVSLGMGFRYDYERSGWGWKVAFDYSKLHAQGAVLLNSGKGTTYLTNQDAYVVCPTSGVEERIYINLGILKTFHTDKGVDIELSAGGNVNNTKVESSDISIGGVTYSILDIWGGQSPSSYTASYEYVNQGGIGYGAYLSLAAGFTLLSGTAMSVGYTLHYNKVSLDRYASAAPHHVIQLNVAINNFSLF